MKLQINIERDFWRSAEVAKYFQENDCSLDEAAELIRKWYCVGTTPYRCGRGGHHVWLSDDGGNRLMLISESTREIITWNTGRKYQFEGQIILATPRPQNPDQVIFFDVSRGIMGVVTCELDPTAILAEYDYNRYHGLDRNDWDAFNLLMDRAIEEAR